MISCVILTTKHFIDYQSLTSTKITNILPVEVYDQLRRTNIYESIKQILEQTATLAFERYQAPKYIDFWNKWKTDSKVRLRIVRLIKRVIEYIKYLSHGQFTQSQLYYEIFKYIFKNDETFKGLIQKIVHKDFVDTHNKLIKQTRHDKANGIKNAIVGIINYTTREQYQRWRYQV